MNRILRYFSKEIKDNSLERTQKTTDSLIDNDLLTENGDLKAKYVWYPPTPQGKLIDSVRFSVPKLSSDLRKGNLGKIGIIGGSKEYSGAPYFAGISSLKIGADLCHVFCTPEAATPIKCYSPDLIVHPLLPSSQCTFDKEICNKSIESIRHWLLKLDIVVVGCGLGREKEIIYVVAELVKICRSLSLPIVIDADGLFLISKQPDLIDGYKNCILTPNFKEFIRLESSMKIEPKDLVDSLTNESDCNYKGCSNNYETPHIQIQNEVSRVSYNIDTRINVPKVLPLETNDGRCPELKSPHERTPNIEWPSTNTDTKLEFHDDGEEINLLLENESYQKNSHSDPQLKTGKIGLISNPLQMCFYEHVINENCIRGCNKNNLNTTESHSEPSDNSFLLVADRVFNLSRKLGNICIVLKDKIDIISNGNEVAICNIAGTFKRSGGQGDILSGTISTLFYWGIRQSTLNSENDNYIMYPDLVSAYGACLLVRLSAHISFKKRFRSMVASDLVDSLPHVFNSIFEINSKFSDEEYNTLLVFNESLSPSRNNA